MDLDITKPDRLYVNQVWPAVLAAAVVLAVLASIGIYVVRISKTAQAAAEQQSDGGAQRVGTPIKVQVVSFWLLKWLAFKFEHQRNHTCNPIKSSSIQ
jgi:hypothetical protein